MYTMLTSYHEGRLLEGLEQTEIVWYFRLNRGPGPKLRQLQESTEATSRNLITSAVRLGCQGPPALLMVRALLWSRTTDLSVGRRHLEKL